MTKSRGGGVFEVWDRRPLWITTDSCKYSREGSISSQMIPLQVDILDLCVTWSVHLILEPGIILAGGGREVKEIF